MQIVEEVITVGQAMAFTVPFVILALIALALTLRLFRTFSEAAPKTNDINRRRGNRMISAQEASRK